MQILHGSLRMMVISQMKCLELLNFTYSYYGNNYTYSTPLNSTDSGLWEWKDNKESLDIEWSYAGSTEVEILRLTNNELIIDSDGVEYEFEKN